MLRYILKSTSVVFNIRVGTYIKCIKDHLEIRPYTIKK